MSTPNMNLLTPTVAVTPGPDWAEQLNADLTLIDQHDHTPGYGVQITPAGFNINTNLSFNAFQATNLEATNFSAVGSLATLRSLYVISSDLYYNDNSGNVIRLTQGGSIVGTAGNITGLVSPASATYIAPTFVFQSNVLTPANLDAGSIILRNILPSSNGLTLTPPAALASNYTITLPLLPVSNKIMALDNSGNMTAAIVVDDSTIQLSANTLQVKDLGITDAKIANATITAGKMATGVLAVSKTQTITSDGNFTVPAGVTWISVRLLGGGGGGGGGGGSNAPTNGGGGGGGQSGQWFELSIPVTPAAVLAVVIGAGGTSGAGGTTDNTGTQGGAGGNTTITIDGIVYKAYGGSGGIGGVRGSDGGGTAAGGAGAIFPGGFAANGGAGGGLAANGGAGSDSIANVGGALGTNLSSGGGGGGGGSSLSGIGGGGGTGGAVGSGGTGGTGPLGYGAGGGGGGGGGTANRPGGAGGAASAGLAIITWVGPA